MEHNNNKSNNVELNKKKNLINTTIEKTKLKKLYIKKRKKKKKGNEGKSSRLASVETERHFNVQDLIIPYVPWFHFLKSEQLQKKNFKYILQKP